MTTETKKEVKNLSLEKVFSAICFLAGLAFLIVAVLGLWRHFFTMGLCFTVGVMMSDEDSSSDVKEKRREAK